MKVLLNMSHQKYVNIRQLFGWIVFPDLESEGDDPYSVVYAKFAEIFKTGNQNIDNYNNNNNHNNNADNYNCSTKHGVYIMSLLV